MPAITYADFSGGIDRRLPINVQEASRLWVLRNAYITNGKRIKKRPGLTVLATGLNPSVGLEAVNGRLKVFIPSTATLTPQTIVDAVKLTTPPGLTSGQFLQRVYYASMFQGYIYAVAEYDPSGVYTGGSPESGIPKPPSPGSSL